MWSHPLFGLLFVDRLGFVHLQFCLNSVFNLKELKPEIWVDAMRASVYVMLSRQKPAQRAGVLGCHDLPLGPRLTGSVSCSESLSDLRLHVLTCNRDDYGDRRVIILLTSPPTHPVGTVCTAGPAACWDPPPHVHHTEGGRVGQPQSLTLRCDLESNQLLMLKKKKKKE